MIALDCDWLAENPLAAPAEDTDKNARGRLLIVGGALHVPGALRLTGEAAFRAGTGKVQLATVEAAALPLGARFPEAATYGLATNSAGEIDRSAAGQVTSLLKRSDALVAGPGMGREAGASALLRALLKARPALPLLLDAGMLHAAHDDIAALKSYPHAHVLTPHPGEMAALMGVDETDLGPALAEEAAHRFGAIIVLKGPVSWIAGPDFDTLRYAGGGPGLATAGSGDVLAGVIGGLMARGIEPRIAAGWGVWAHGEAGAELARRIARVGFLARELLPRLPGFLDPSQPGNA